MIDKIRAVSLVILLFAVTGLIYMFISYDRSPIEEHIQSKIQFLLIDSLNENVKNLKIENGRINKIFEQIQTSDSNYAKEILRIEMKNYLEKIMAGKSNMSTLKKLIV